MEDSIEHPGNFFCLVRNETQILGYVPSDFIWDEPGHKHDGPLGGLVGQHCIKISPDQIVAGELPLIDLLPLFTQHFFFFVLNSNDLSHTVSFIDLDVLPVKLCLFTLIIGLEAELLRILARHPYRIESYLDLLPTERRTKAEGVAERKLRRVETGAYQVLIATTFIDKITMLMRSPELASQLPFPSTDKAEQYFNRLRDLRNQIAHSDSVLAILPTPEDFAAFLTQLRQVMSTVEALAAQVDD